MTIDKAIARFKDTGVLMDVQYVSPRKQADGKRGDDCLYLIIKDTTDDSKHVVPILHPEMPIYYEKPEYRNHLYCKNSALLDEVTGVSVPYDKIINHIFNTMKTDGWTTRYQKRNEAFLYPYVFGADFDVRTYYRYYWYKHTNDDVEKNFTKGFLDIETDIMEAPGMPNPSFDPIDLVTFIDASANNAYTFIVVDRPYIPKDLGSNPTPDEIEAEERRRYLYEKRHITENFYIEHIDEMKAKIREKFDEAYPGMNYNVFFYKDEAKMLVHLFQLINRLKLDFIGVWNISFDIPYIIDRLTTLGLNPAEVICGPEFPIKECYFKKDRLHFEVKNKTDFFRVSSCTVFYDQMINYAAIRKGQQELRSSKLTYVAKKEIGDEKLDYSEVGNLKVLGYEDWFTYVLYNIKDVLLQKGIEEATFDIDSYYTTSYENITPYEHVYKQTSVLRNVQYKEYLDGGRVPGNNINGIMLDKKALEQAEKEDEDDDDDAFEGALVGNPKLISNFGVKMFGRRTNNIFRYNIDFDMKAFYPYTIITMNIDSSTLIFKMILDSSQYDVRGGNLKFNGFTDAQVVKTNSDSFEGDVAKEVMDNFQTGDYVSTGHKWMNLPSVSDVYKRCAKRFGGKK